MFASMNISPGPPLSKVVVTFRCPVLEWDSQIQLIQFQCPRLCLPFPYSDIWSCLRQSQFLHLLTLHTQSSVYYSSSSVFIPLEFHLLSCKPSSVLKNKLTVGLLAKMEAWVDTLCFLVQPKEGQQPI